MPLKFQPYMRKNVPQSILNAYILIMVHKLLEKNTYDFVMSKYNKHTHVFCLSLVYLHVQRLFRTRKSLRHVRFENYFQIFT